MKRKSIVRASIASFLILFLSLTGTASAGGEVTKEYLDQFKPITESVVDNPSNPVTPAKVKLGKMLYFDVRLSKSGFLSCNTCHNLSMFGVSGLSTDIGHKWVIGPINGPTVLNSAFNIAQFWNGRAKDLEEQAKGPILNPGEMAMPIETYVEKKINSIPGYRALFTKAFPDDKEPATYNNIAMAIAAFERTLLTPSRFDRFLTGDANALTGQEIRGLKLFVETGCTGCHNGIAIGGGSFQKLGVVKPYKTASEARGRFDISKKEEDINVFKVPTLRNIEMTYPYFHDGKVWQLEEAVRTMADIQLGTELKDNEIADIVAFLKSLTGTIPADALNIPILPPSGKDTQTPDAN
ncbi:MAG: cytochrome-c peroxidase [Deltaproteobacteria bacterium]|nr:cytochrome-c peroxidase [Deltaproteobacteria bacterium]